MFFVKSFMHNLDKKYQMDKKIPMPKTGKINSWEDFVRMIRNSIKRKLGNGKINFNKNL